MTKRPDENGILDEAWDQIVGGMDWLKSVFFGEFSDNRPLSAVIADMLMSFLPGVVIVTSARDAVAVILRLANHPEKREDLMEWVLLCACLIVIALPLAMAAGGFAAAGVGAIVGGIAGSELGAALRAVMLLLIKEASKLVELVRFLQKFIKGDILKFLRAVKFAQYEKVLIQALNKISGKLLEIVKSLRSHLDGLRYFDSAKAGIAKLVEWEKKFYAVQQDALKQIPKALVELDARLGKVLAQTAPKETHTVSAGVQVDKTAGTAPAKQRVRDTPGNVLANVADDTPAAGAGKPQSQPKPQTKNAENAPEPSLQPAPDPSRPPDDRSNTKKQDALDAESTARLEKTEKIVEKVGGNIKNHPLRQAYEAEVAGLKEEAEMMSKSGVSKEVTARKMWARRREIGVKYKSMTPEPLRDYIFDLNLKRYKDPLGPSFDMLKKEAEEKLLDPYEVIIKSSSRPNSDIDKLLSKFKNWLAAKDFAYLDDSLKNMKD